MCAAKEGVWNNVDEDCEMACTAWYHQFRATGKTNEAALVVHHKIDRFCCQAPYREHLEQTRSVAYSMRKHVERGRVNENVNGDGKAFMNGKAVTASAIQGFYASYDALCHMQRGIESHVKKHDDTALDKDYLHKFHKDAEVLLAFYLERLGDTWEKATTPSLKNGLTNKSTGNKPWTHVQGISEGRRYIGAVKNRMTWLEHCRKHTKKHSRA